MRYRLFFFVRVFLGGLIVCWGGCSVPPKETSIRLPVDSGPSGRSPDQVVKRSHHSLPDQPALGDFLRVAALNHPGLEAAFEGWKAALQAVPQARALPDPKFNYGYFVEQVETRVGPQRQRFGISQTFPWLGKLRLRESVAGQAAAAARERYELVKRGLFREVKINYFELGYLRQAIRLTEENISLIQHLEQVAQARFRAGSDATGVVKAQVELTQLEDELVRLRDLREPLSARLNAALNRRMDAPIPWPERHRLDPPTLADLAVDEAHLMAHPELKVWDAEIEKAEFEVALARKAFYPDVTVGVDYVETQDARFAGVAGSGRDPVMIMGSVNLPLWKGKYRAGLKEAVARQEVALESKEDRKNDLGADLKLAVYEYRDAERKIRLYRDTLAPLASNSLKVAEQAYQSGRSDFLQLIDAQRLLLDIQLSHQRALADRMQRLAEIEMMVGELPSSGGNPSHENE